jgi:hypothetical protein
MRSEKISFKYGRESELTYHSSLHERSYRLFFSLERREYRYPVINAISPRLYVTDHAFLKLDVLSSSAKRST